MNPDHAIAVHLAWKLALRDSTRTGAVLNLDAATLERPDRCELGLWLESPRACFEGIAEFRDLHARFHATAGVLTRRLQEGEPVDGLALHLRELEQVSAQLLGRLRNPG